MDGKRTVEPADRFSFIVNLIQHIIGVCVYTVLGRCSKIN